MSVLSSSGPPQTSCDRIVWQWKSPASQAPRRGVPFAPDLFCAAASAPLGRAIPAAPAPAVAIRRRRVSPMRGKRGGGVLAGACAAVRAHAVKHDVVASDVERDPLG